MLTLRLDQEMPVDVADFFKSVPRQNEALRFSHLIEHIDSGQPLGGFQKEVADAAWVVDDTIYRLGRRFDADRNASPMQHQVALSHQLKIFRSLGLVAAHHDWALELRGNESLLKEIFLEQNRGTWMLEGLANPHSPICGKATGIPIPDGPEIYVDLHCAILGIPELRGIAKKENVFSVIYEAQKETNPWLLAFALNNAREEGYGVPDGIDPAATVAAAARVRNEYLGARRRGETIDYHWENMVEFCSMKDMTVNINEGMQSFDAAKRKIDFDRLCGLEKIVNGGVIGPWPGLQADRQTLDDFWRNLFLRNFELRQEFGDRLAPRVKELLNLEDRKAISETFADATRACANTSGGWHPGWSGLVITEAAAAPHQLLGRFSGDSFRKKLG